MPRFGKLDVIACIAHTLVFRIVIRVHTPQHLQSLCRPPPSPLGSDRFLDRFLIAYILVPSACVAASETSGNGSVGSARGLGVGGVGTGSGARLEEASADVLAEVSERLVRLQVLVLLRRLYRDVTRSERVLSMPVPRVVSQEEEVGGASEAAPLAEKKRKGRKKIRDWTRDVRGLQGDGREAGEGLEIAVGSGFEVLDYAEDIRELGEALKRDLEIFEGYLMEVFEVKFRI